MRPLVALLFLCACDPFLLEPQPSSGAPPPTTSTSTPPTLTAQQTCSFNCSGCCTSGGTCLAGTDDSACGFGGQSCTSCPDNQRCEAAAGGGHCGSCSALNCPGCCTLDGTCLDGTSDVACGSGGQTCVTCTNPTRCNPAGSGSPCE